MHIYILHSQPKHKKDKDLEKAQRKTQRKMAKDSIPEIPIEDELDQIIEGGYILILNYILIGIISYLRNYLINTYKQYQYITLFNFIFIV